MKSQAQYMAEVHGIVVRVGWAVQGVMAAVGDEPTPSFSYTIGFGPTLGHPELALFGINPHTAMGILNDLGERIKAGSRFAEGRQMELVRGRDGYSLPTHIIPVPSELHSENFGVASRYYREHRLGALTVCQIVWSDEDGVLPWETGFNEDMRAAQPILGVPPQVPS